MVVGIEDVLQQDEAKDDVLVLGGVHLPAKVICGDPKSSFSSNLVISPNEFPLKVDVITLPPGKRAALVKLRA